MPKKGRASRIEAAGFVAGIGAALLIGWSLLGVMFGHGAALAVAAAGLILAGNAED